MKKLLLTTTILAMTAGAALAADLPSRKAEPFLPPPPPPPPMWTGFYAGLHAGYGWGTSNSFTTTGGSVYDPFAVSAGTISNFVTGIFPGADIPAIGGGWPLGGLAGASSGFGNANSNGFIGGAQIGYNYQWGSSIVLGIEADISGSGINGSGSAAGLAANQIGSGPFDFNIVNSSPGVANYNGNFTNGVTLDRSAVGVTTVRTNLDYIGTVRGRIGWLATPTLLVYGTGGFAYGGARISATNYINGSAGLNWSNFQNTITPTGAEAVPVTTQFGPGGVNLSGTSVPGVGNRSSMLAGWTAGGGLEWMFMPNWSLKAEALYYNLGSLSVTTSPAIVYSPVNVNLGALGGPGFGIGALAGGPLYANSSRTSANFGGVIARAGVNYHFNWGAAAPIVAKY